MDVFAIRRKGSRHPGVRTPLLASTRANIKENSKMTNDLMINDETALSHFAQVAVQAQEARLLKFIKGKYLSGEDEVSPGREYIAHVSQLVHGWIKFDDCKVVEQRVGPVAEGYNPCPRDHLGDIDKSKWEVDGSGARRDPWTRQYYLPIEDAETGELLTYVTGSRGGNAAIGRLCSHFVRNVKRGLPIIRLAVSSYKHKSYGRIEVPEFPIVGWTGAAVDANAGAQKITLSAGEEMDDEVPF
jgi:hypothetical protein